MKTKINIDDTLLKKTFVTSDCHFGSYRLNPLWQVFSKDTEDALIDVWNDVVPKDGLVLYVGDFVDGDENDLKRYRSRLNGDIILIKGNHDKLSDDVYESCCSGVTSFLEVSNLGLQLQHIPFVDTTHSHKVIYGHLHRHCELGRKFTSHSFCACVMRNTYAPTKLEDALALMNNVA